MAQQAYAAAPPENHQPIKMKQRFAPLKRLGHLRSIAGTRLQTGLIHPDVDRRHPSQQFIAQPVGKPQWEP
jgi:hypothetical protein